jgi:eukaryotic-like serine/threonine-protein kinase
MDKDTANRLLQAVRDCGLYTPEQVAAAEKALDAGGGPAAVADALQSAGVLTAYQARKVRIGRIAELLFGPFLVLDKIGEGGMGKVYKAVHVPDRRVIALKVVRPQLMTNRVVLRRYKREAAAGAALDHPNIVSLYDADEVNGRYYIAMEYVDGLDLARMMKEYGSPPTSGLPQYQEAVEYIRQAAIGLSHAHGRGMVHRDIKPSNLLVYGTRALVGETEKPAVKILDMGLVRGVIEDDGSNSELTRDGTVVGTPDYMAPEQAKNSSTVDARADLYSLGCALYFLLKGQSPFPDGSPIDKLLRHQLDPAPEIRKYRPDVPAGLAAVIDKLMRKDPADRYQTAAEVAQALAPFCPNQSGVVPADEPFVLAAHPDAVAQLPPQRPPTTVVLPAAAPTRTSGPARVRVVRAVSGDPAGRVVDAEMVSRPPARVPGPTAVPRADNSPSSGSLPGSTPTRPPSKSTRPLASNSTPPGRRRDRERTPISRGKRRDRRTGPSPVMIMVLLGGAVVLAIGAAFVIHALIQRGTGSPATGRKAELTRPLAAPSLPRAVDGQEHRADHRRPV